MGAVYDRALELAELLTAAGVPTTTDIATAGPGVAVITPPTLEFDLLSGSTSLTWTVTVTAPGPGNGQAWHGLDDLVDKVRELLDVDTARPAALEVGSSLLPAYALTFADVV